MKTPACQNAVAGHWRSATLFAGLVLAAAGCSARPSAEIPDEPKKENETMSSGGAAPRPPSAPAPTPEITAQLNLLAKLADSPRSEDQSELARRLGDARTLDQLDEPKVRDRSGAAELRVGLVLTHLRTNPAPAAAQTLASLTRSAAFNASWQRQELLVRALATQRPLSTDSLAFMDAQSQPDEVNLHIAIEAMCDNGSEPALLLLGRKLADPKLDSVFKIGWMRGPILIDRREPGLLRAAEGWLSHGGLDSELRVALAEALFDYRPDEWYPGREGLPRPPAETATTPEAAVVVRRIAQAVLASDYPPSVKAAARRTLAKLPGK